MAEPRKGRELRATFIPWLRLLARRRGRLVAGTALMALTLFAALGLLALSGWFITAASLAGIAMAAGMTVSLNVYVPGGGIRFFAVTRTVSRYVERLYNHDTVLRLLADLRARLFAAMAGLDDQALSRRRASDWLNRLTADIDTLDALYLRLLAPPGVALLAIVVLAAFLMLWSPAAGLAALLLLGLAWLWLTLGQARLGMAASHRQVADLEALRGRLIEQCQGMAELEAYSSLEAHRRGLEAIESRILDDQRRLGHLAALGSALVGLATGVTLVAVLWLAAQAHASGEVSGPVMVMMTLAVLAMSEALVPLSSAFTRLGSTRAAAERLNALEAPQPRTRNGETWLPTGPLEVTLDDVTLVYPDSVTPALEGVSLSLAPGERLALCGASGAGKSSVAALLAGRVVPRAGRVRVGGLDPGRLASERLAERVAVLTQGVDLFDDSLAANLRIGDARASEARLWQVLSAVELADWAAGLPRGIETRVGEGGRQLSGGQARRLAMARLLLRTPGLVLLDEPFAGLDAATAARIAPRLDAWLQCRTVVFLVHELGTAVDPPGIDHRLTLREGRLCTNGQDVSGCRH